MNDVLQEVFSLDFKDRPKYDTLREIFQTKIEYIKNKKEMLNYKPLVSTRAISTSDEKTRIVSDKSISDEFLQSLVNFQSNQVSAIYGNTFDTAIISVEVECQPIVEYQTQDENACLINFNLNAQEDQDMDSAV